MHLQVDQNGIPVLNQFSEEGFVDCVFQIQKLCFTEVVFQFHMSATFNSESLGLDASVFRNIKAGFDENMDLNRNHVYQNGVKFSRSGEESD